MTFQLDTSGEVRAHEHWCEGDEVIRWSDLSPFCQEYVEAMLAYFRAGLLTQTVGFDHPDIIAFGEKVRALGFRHLAPATLARIIEDCEGLQRLFPGDSAKHGGWLWSERNKRRWTDFPPLLVTLGDDGLIYLGAGQ